jgi:hypothetical protein
MRNNIGRATTARRNIVGGGWLRLGKIFSVFIFDHSESKLRGKRTPVVPCFPRAFNLRIEVTKVASCVTTSFHDLLNEAEAGKDNAVKIEGHLFAS